MRSTLSRSTTVTAASSRSSAHHTGAPSPRSTGTSATSASSRAEHGLRASPSGAARPARPRPRSAPVSATVAMRVTDCEMSGSSAFAVFPSAASASTMPASTVGRNGPGHAAATELLEHDRELHRAVPRAAERLGYVQRRSSRARRAGPRTPGRASASASTVTRTHGGRRVRLDEAADDRAELFVLGGDPDRHAPIVPRS